MMDQGVTLSGQSMNAYSINAMACFNTIGQLPTFADIHQMTITHKDGNLHKEIPKPLAPTCGIMSRAAEDAAKISARKTRLDKSKPMKTLNDVFDAFKMELDEQKYEHKRQVQEWASKIKDSWIKKIDPPKAKKAKTPSLPIDYKIKLNGEYKGYPVDNRNMPNEQPEQDQTKPGIRSLTVRAGTTITKCIENLMKLSKKTGQDVTSGFSFKNNTSVYRKCDGNYEVTTLIEKYKIPRNETDGVDTGPGEGAVNPLEFEFQKFGTSDSDILSVRMAVGTDVNFGVLETQVVDPEAETVLGGREQFTFERIPQKEFFKTAFSGVRTLTNVSDFGVQNPGMTANVDFSLSDYVNSQTSILTVIIKGNSDLLSDLNRNPQKAANNSSDGPVLYAFPEYYPMYVKLKIYIKDESALGQDVPNGEPLFYYHTYYYHLAKVTSVIQGSNFVQELKLQRTDDVT